MWHALCYHSIYLDALFDNLIRVREYTRRCYSAKNALAVSGNLGRRGTVEVFAFRDSILKDQRDATWIELLVIGRSITDRLSIQG